MADMEPRLDVWLPSTFDFSIASAFSRNFKAGCWRREFTTTRANRAFSHDVTGAIFVFQNKDTAAMLVLQTSPVGIKLFSYVNAFFCSNKYAKMLVARSKGQFCIIKIYTWVRGWEVWNKRNRRDSGMYNSFLLIFSFQSRSQVLLLIIRNWSIIVPHAARKRLEHRVSYHTILYHWLLILFSTY